MSRRSYEPENRQSLRNYEPDQMSPRSYEPEDRMSKSSCDELEERMSGKSYELDRMSRSSSSGGSPLRREEEITSVMPSAELYYGEDSPECSPGRSVQVRFFLIFYCNSYSVSIFVECFSKTNLS